jgi:manganese/zinc/iron transport system permease protein
MDMSAFLAALTFAAGYNTALVCLGAALLGAAAGGIGSFVMLRKRALMSDAVSHATLPGLVLAFIVMALATGDGRFLPGLMIGAALTAFLGLHAVDWLTRRTRLPEDSAIGAVLSSFFGLGVVLLTVVQSLDTGGQAGLESFLLGSTASMLRSEAITIAVAAAMTGLAVILFRRAFTIVSFDPHYAASIGIPVRRTDLVMLLILLLVTVIGLRVAGLVLIVALTIIPPATARFWTQAAGWMAVLSALVGALAAHAGAALSASGPSLPTGAVIVLISFGLFVLSLIASPRRGLVAAAVSRRIARRRTVA